MSDDRAGTRFDRHTPNRWYGWVAANWLLVLALGSATLLGVSTALRFVIGPYYISLDSAFFQHAGWYITQGATPYVDFWDLKPPLIYAVTTVLAFVSGGNMTVLHLLSLLLANAVVAVGVTLVGVLAYRLTDHGPASLVAGATAFVLPTVYTFPSAGIRPKYFAFAFGVGALLLAVEDRPAASGVAAALGTGFWQLGGPLALLVVAVAFQRGGPRAMGRAIAGGLAVAVAVVAPFVAADLTVPLFLETVVAPVYAVERYTVGGRVLEFVLEVGYGVFLLPLALAGWWQGVRKDPSRYWWVGVGGTLYSFQLFLEMQGAIELILLVPFLGIGVAVLVANAPTPSRASAVAVAVVLLAVLNLFWTFGPVTPVKDEVEAVHDELSISDYETVAPLPENVPSMETIYWEKHKPESCHYRAGYKQRFFVEKTGTTVDKPTCGQWPFEEPPRAWLLGKLSPF